MYSKFNDYGMQMPPQIQNLNIIRVNYARNTQKQNQFKNRLSCRYSTYSCSSRLSQKKGLKLAKNLQHAQKQSNKQNLHLGNIKVDKNRTSAFGRNSYYQLSNNNPMRNKVSSVNSCKVFFVTSNTPVVTDSNAYKLINRSNSVKHLTSSMQSIRNSPHPVQSKAESHSQLNSIMKLQPSLNNIQSGTPLLQINKCNKNEHFRGSIIDNLNIPSMKNAQ